MQIELSQEAIDFLRDGILKNITVSAASPESLRTVQLVKEIIEALPTEELINN